MIGQLLCDIPEVEAVGESKEELTQKLNKVICKMELDCEIENQIKSIKFSSTEWPFPMRGNQLRDHDHRSTISMAELSVGNFLKTTND